MSNKTVTVIGAGNMGTALAQVVAENGFNVKIWNWEGDIEPLTQIASFQENRKYLKGVKLSKKIKAEKDLEKAVSGASIVIFALPTNVILSNFKKTIPFLNKNSIVVDSSKGVCPDTFGFIPELMKKNKEFKGSVVAISGPAIARQMATRNYTFMNIASKDEKAIKVVSSVLQNDFLKLYPTSDIVGVELGGFTKNVYSIILGICDGLGFSENTKAVFVVLALEEMSILNKVFFGKDDSVYSFAGIGDLITTGFSKEGRNRSFGEALGKGMSPKYAIKKVGQTVEGVSAVKALLSITKTKKIELPLAKLVSKCVKTTGKIKQKKLIDMFLKKI
ncbi:MAG: NAD(P)H-dependent glycerol-3-phosphate dehydrogenase [Candidatus Magasanikbacteria bacterium]|nr:NAD(P)H-dependent glycerol-3-phosphate dehydrogenase [Candidatus Magasanikbacteria bacterium]